MLFLPFHTCWHEFHCVWLLKITIIVIVQLPSRCLTLCDPMDCSTPGLCLSPSPGVCPNSCPLNWWCHPTISSSVALFSCLWPFPASGSFPVSQLFVSGASVLELQLQHQSFQRVFRVDFLLRSTGLISFLSKRLSRDLSRTTCS